MSAPLLVESAGLDATRQHAVLAIPEATDVPSGSSSDEYPLAAKESPTELISRGMRITFQVRAWCIQRPAISLSIEEKIVPAESGLCGAKSG
jgi:hypothetical protein